MYNMQKELSYRSWEDFASGIQELQEQISLASCVGDLARLKSSMEVQQVKLWHWRQSFQPWSLSPSSEAFTYLSTSFLFNLIQQIN